jgi:hypothetical protein
MKLESNLNCPSCSQALVPKVLKCNQCEISVEGDFHFNEFATLAAEDLHFLRIFVQCEGRVKDMEAALGLSYPTIRGRITDLKNKIGTSSGETEPPPATELTIPMVLDRLDRKELSFEDAMKQIRKLRTASKGKSS